MSDLMEEAIDALRHVPRDMRNDLARVVLQLTGKEQLVYVFTEAEDAELAESEAEADRGDFVTDDEVRAIWAKHGL